MPSFSLDASLPPHEMTKVSLYEEADDGIGCDEDGVLTWDLPKDGTAPATSPPFFIKGMALDPTRPAALTAPAIELEYTPKEDGGAEVTLQVVPKDNKKKKSSTVKVKFECKLGGQSSGTKACMGKKMTVSFPAIRKTTNGSTDGKPIQIHFKVLQIL